MRCHFLRLEKLGRSRRLFRATGEAEHNLLRVVNVECHPSYVCGLKRLVADGGAELGQQTFVPLDLGRRERRVQPVTDDVGSC